MENQHTYSQKDKVKAGHSSLESRKRQSDKWIALQASEMPVHEDIRLDPPAPAKNLRKSGLPTNVYMHLVNSQIDRALAAQKQWEAKTKETK